MLDMVWLAIAFPLLGTVINGIFGRYINNKLVSGVIGCMALGLSFITAVLVWMDYAWHWTDRGTDAFHEVILWKWIHVGQLELDAALLVDPLSITMMLFVTGISFLIHIYSTGYMSHDAGYSRFFTYLNLFVTMMLILVLANNGIVMFVGWEGVGLCSYLLIGFWYQRMYNANCGMKAFIVNRIGDFGILIGMFALFMVFGTLNFVEINESAAHVLAMNGGWVPLVIGIFLFLGATGKSAQWPLHIWLPDAMAGPTPVSALIHAATMVTAGVYMVARMHVIFDASAHVGLIVAVIGAFTAFMAATIALTQHDIKKVLAYSTVSQLGYMFLACGIGAYWVAIFHVVTHAFFKACLFLGSGSVIHGMHEEQDTRRMGGLKKYMPWTYWTFVISTLAIAGIIPFAGFFSKDEILWKVAIWQSEFGGWLPVLLWVVATVTALMTAFYMGRVTWKTFHGKERWTPDFKSKHGHPHESSPSMVMPLVVLAVGAVIGGFVLFTPPWLGGNTMLKDWLAPSVSSGEELHAAVTAHWVAAAADSHGSAATAEGAAAGHVEHQKPFISFGNHTLDEVVFALISLVLAVIGLVWSFRWFAGKLGATDSLKAKLKPLYSLSLNKWWWDEIYHNAIVIPGVALAYASWRFFDVRIIDGIVNGSAWTVGAFGQIFRPLQTGFVRNYALYILLGVIMLFMLTLLK